MNHAQSAKFETKVNQPGINTFWIADKFICCGRFAISFYLISIVLCNVACVCTISCYCETFTYAKCLPPPGWLSWKSTRPPCYFCRYICSWLHNANLNAPFSLKQNCPRKIALSLCLSCYFVPWKPSPFLGCSFCLPQIKKDLHIRVGSTVECEIKSGVHLRGFFLFLAC